MCWIIKYANVKKIKPQLLRLPHVFAIICFKVLPSLYVCLFISPASSLTVFLSFSVCLPVCDGGVAVSEDGLPTQKPASRAVAERPASQPAQCSSYHAGTSLLRHCESALSSPLLLYLSLTEEEREKKGGSV